MTTTNEASTTISTIAQLWTIHRAWFAAAEAYCKLEMKPGLTAEYEMALKSAEALMAKRDALIEKLRSIDPATIEGIAARAVIVRILADEKLDGTCDFSSAGDDWLAGIGTTLDKLAEREPSFKAA